MTGVDDTVTYRDAFVAVYKEPLTWIAIVGAFGAAMATNFLAGVAFVVLVGGYSANRTVNKLIDQENST